MAETTRSTYTTHRQKETVRLNVVLPRSLAEELRRLVPARQRSQLIADATAERLARLKLQQALAEAKGAWHDEDHPELAAGVESWRDELRQIDEARWQEPENDGE